MTVENSLVDKYDPDYRKRLEKQRDLLLRKQKLTWELPHLYGHKHYWWSRRFFESRKAMNFLTAANQMGKSSVQIKKCIHWATATELWPELWPGREVSLFFYLYPSIKLATREYKTKWVKEFLPRGDMKDDKQYGWKPEFKNGEIHALHFNSGVSVFFLSYAMSVDDLQASTPSAIFCDEEIPVAIYPELIMRVEASKGYFHLVCTPTKGQQFFRDIFERKNVLPDSLVITASLYDAVKYEDGSPGQYSIEDVNKRKAKLGTEAEIQLRVYGRFVKIEGLVYAGFHMDRNVRPGGKIPSSWKIAAAVDVGSGGEEGHPAAIIFVAVEMGAKGAMRGRIFKAWRGDGIVTTNSDILEQYVKMKGAMTVDWQMYDHASADFKIQATRANLPFVGANKGSSGIGLVNSLYKNGMLIIDEDCPEGEKLINEIENLRNDQKKNHAKDDLCDATRYAVSKIPWDLSLITGPSVPEEPTPEPVKKLTRDDPDDLLNRDEISSTCDELNCLYGGDF